MTPDRLLELRKLCKSSDGEHNDSSCAKCDEPCITDEREFNAGDWCWPCCAEFTAAARTAVPELLDEVERLNSYAERLAIESMRYALGFVTDEYAAESIAAAKAKLEANNV